MILLQPVDHHAGYRHFLLGTGNGTDGSFEGKRFIDFKTFNRTMRRPVIIIALFVIFILFMQRIWWLQNPLESCAAARLMPQRLEPAEISCIVN